MEEPEFIDEGPGSYLSELGTRSWSVVWGAMNFLLTLGVGQTAYLTRVGPNSEWYMLARLVWILLLVSALLLGILTLWQLATAFTKKSPIRSGLSFLGAIATIVLWLVYRVGLSVLGADS